MRERLAYILRWYKTLPSLLLGFVSLSSSHTGCSSLSRLVSVRTVNMNRIFTAFAAISSPLLSSVRATTVVNTGPTNTLHTCLDRCVVDYIDTNIPVLSMPQNESHIHNLDSHGPVLMKQAGAAQKPLGLAQLSANNENVVLANCQDSQGVKSSQMAYFSGSPNGSPNAIAQVQTDHGLTVYWEGGAAVSATFPDGNVFSASIPQAVPDGAYAGTGKNKQGEFTCWRKYTPNLYTHNGVNCYGVYDCNHSAIPVDGTQVDIHIKPGTINLDDQYNLVDIYRNVWDKRGPQDCDETPVQIGKGTCHVSFNCHGEFPNWQSTNGMAGTLANVVATTPKMASTTNISPKCLKEGFIGQFLVCEQWGPSVVSVVPHEVDIFVSNVPPAGSGRGGGLKAQLTATISCAANGADSACDWCKASQLALSAANLIPVIGPLFGLANVGATALCDSQGC
jgi:hypothetical protein